jgi:hemoglobin-like flavoprotein
MRAELITQSFELAADVCEDLTPLVYARLFRQQPGMEAMFVRDTNGQVRGEMLARVIEAILDFVGERRYAATLIQCEVITHDGYDVPPQVFRTFFGVVAETVREVVGAGWTPAMDEAWRSLLVDLDFYVTHSDQSQTVGV